MKTRADLFPYQRDKMIPHMVSNPNAMVWAFMGSGKTACSLYAASDLMEFGFLQRGIIFGPLRVAQGVWDADAREWEELRGLRFAKLTGSPKHRLRQLFRTDVDFYLCNYEKAVWLWRTLKEYFVDRGKPLPFQLAIYDEIDWLKGARSKRTMALAGGNYGNKWFWGLWDHVDRHWGLTGTPATSGLQDLHGQYLAVDGGERLGRGVTHFKDQFFYQVGQFRELKMKESTPNRIREAISDITLQLKEEDYSQLPAFRYVDLWVDLPDPLRRQYDALEKEMFTQLDSGTEVEVFNKASVTNKCLQFAGGAVYLVPGQPQAENVHDLKLDALDEILAEIGDKPLLVTYQFKVEAKRIMEKYPFAVNLSGVAGTRAEEIIAAWNRGEIKMMIGHPLSMGHGLNLQKGSNFMAAVGQTWIARAWLQWVKRIHRTGQSEQVTCFRILVRDTADEMQKLALESKKADEEAFRDSLEEYRRKRGM